MVPQLKRSNSMKLYKYELPIEDASVLRMHKGAQLLTVQIQYEIPHVWALVDTTKEIEDRTLFVVGTGHTLPEEAGDYVGTFQMFNGKLVFHVFEKATG